MNSYTMGLSTHILDTALGRPAAGIPVVLTRFQQDSWQLLGSGLTDADGRCRTLLGEAALVSALYRLEFQTAAYFSNQGIASLYPLVHIVFSIEDPTQHFHIPLLIAPNGYTTYRGS